MHLMIGLLQWDVGRGLPSSVHAFLQHSSEHPASFHPLGKIGEAVDRMPPGWAGVQTGLLTVTSVPLPPPALTSWTRI